MNSKDFSATQSMRDIQHFGEEGGVVPVIDVAATSTFLNPSDMQKVFQGELQGCYLYSRHSNPSVNALGMKLAAMEGMEAALGTASGMSAIAATLEQWVPAGGHILSSRTVYGGTYALFKNLFPRRGLQVTFVDPLSLEEMEAALRPETRAIYVETVSNPLLEVTDLKSLGVFCKKHDLRLIVDNTFSPLSIRPAEFGADAVLYSCTKYISGASDLIAGAVVGPRSLIESLIDVNHGIVMLTGPVMDPRVAHELYLRLDHLPVRMQAHARAAADFASRAHEEKIPVIYPGLPTHPQHALFKKMHHSEYGFGGMLTLSLKTPEIAVQLAAKLQAEKFGLYAVSLGFSRTLMTCPALSTSSEIPTEEQEKMGLTPGLLRLSLGYTGDGTVLFERFLKAYREIVGR